MSFRSLASLRVAASFAVILIVSACSDDRVAQLSAVETIEVPPADAGQQQNQNIANPTLEIPVTYPVGEGDELTLVFSEEFDGPEIDPGTWFFATGDGTEVGLPGGWGNNELQYYLPDNAMIVNGVLEITARRETVGGLNYTSARINTQDRFAFKYGRIEARMKLPGGQGLWPAFWMLSQDSDYLCSGDPCVWAAIGEIDIVEAVNLDGTGGNEIFATIHYGDEFPANQSTEKRFIPSVDVTETFNTYALEWDEDEIRWYFNGELYAEQPSSVWFSAADNAGPNGPFDQNFHVLLNLAVGGNFPGSPDGTTPWPVTMEVDWVRVYSGEPPPADAGDVPENAVFVTDPNVTADLAAPMLDNFGSGATFNPFYAGDPDFKPTLQVTSGNAFGGEDIGFVAFTGYDAGFAADFQTFSFKVKGLPGDELEIKFFGSPENSIIINLDAPGTGITVEELGNGWYQVTVPMSAFAANVYAFTGFLIGPPGDQGAPFSFLLTDIGFNGNIVTTPADAGTTPDVTVYARGAATDLVENEDYTLSGFDSGSLFNRNNTGDVDFSPAFSVTTGDGYSVQVGQLAFLGFGTGFAADYLTLDFKVKGMNNDIIRLKLLEEAPSDYVDITLTSSDFATALGNGWYQVSVPLETFGNVATADSLLFETGGEPPADAFTFLLNDIGFSGTVDTGGGDGELLTNGDFEADLTGWSAGPGVVVSNKFYEVVAADGGNVFDTNLSQALEIIPDENYVLTFRARASVDRVITVGIGDDGPDFRTVLVGGAPGGVSLTTEWQTFTYELTATGIGRPASRVLFDLGTVASTVNIDDVSLALASAPGDNLLTNGDFEADLTGWSAGPGVVVSNKFYEVVAADGGNVFDTNLSQALEIIPDENYVLTFRARASVDRVITVGIGDDGPDFRTVLVGGAPGGVSLTTEWQTFTYELTATGIGRPASRVLFDLGTVASTVNIDDVSLTVAADDTGGVGELLTNGDFEADLTGWSAGPGVVVSNKFYEVVAADGGNVFDTNLSQALEIIPDENYVLTFRARASVDRVITVGIGDDGPDFRTVLVGGAPGGVSLTTEWQTFTYELTATGIGRPASRVLFDLGTVASTVNIDDVSLALASAPGDNLLTNGDFEADLTGWSAGPGVVVSNKFYEVVAADGGNVFDTNLSQALEIIPDENYVLTFRARASVDRVITVGIGDDGPDFRTVLVGGAPGGVSLTTEWQTFTYELTATGIGRPASRVLFDLGTVASTVNIDDVSLIGPGGDAGGGNGGGEGVEIAVNGGFESGDFIGWVQAESAPGNQTVNTGMAGDTSSEGVYHLEINNVTTDTNSLIKQERVGLGVVTPGAAWTVTFDARGSFTPGGVAFAQVFSETAGGSENCTGCGILGGAPLAINADSTVWTSFSFSGTAGPTTESLTLQLEAVAGAGSANMFYDNISIVVTGGGG